MGIRSFLSAVLGRQCAKAWLRSEWIMDKEPQCFRGSRRVIVFLGFREPGTRVLRVTAWLQVLYYFYHLGGYADKSPGPRWRRRR